MKKKYSHYFWSLIIVFASVRGAFVYHLGLPFRSTYLLSAVFLVIFGILSIRSLGVIRGESTFSTLRSAIKINIFFIGFFTVLTMVAVSIHEYSLAYSFMIFPTIFSLIKYEESQLNGIVYAIALISTYGVIYFYNLGILGGFEAIHEAHSKIRGEFAYARIGEVLLPGGYQGSHHDASNILVMCGVFFLSKALIEFDAKKKYLLFTIYLIIIFTTLLTGSAANIIVLGGVSSLALMIYVKKRPFVLALIVCFTLVVLPLITNKISSYTYFYEKASMDQSQLEGGGMFNSLDRNSIFLSFPAIIFGGGHILKVPMVYSEVAFVKILVGVGVIPFIVLIFICLSPFYYIRKYGKSSITEARQLIYHNPDISITTFLKDIRAQQFRLIILSMPIFAGTMTLLHYGSLFRVTSVGLYCVLHALFFKQYLTSMKHFKDGSS